MPRFSIVLLALLVVIPARAMAQADRPPAAPMPSVELPPDLDRVLRDYERQWQARSAAALAALFTEDGFVLRPGQRPVRGRAGITEAYQGAGGSLMLRALAYATSGTVGYIIGGYGYGAGSPDVGKFILALRRDGDGPWHIAADMDNGNSSR